MTREAAEKMFVEYERSLESVFRVDVPMLHGRLSAEFVDEIHRHHQAIKEKIIDAMIGKGQT